MNGRDWWLIAHERNGSANFIKWLITPEGILPPKLQAIGNKHIYNYKNNPKNPMVNNFWWADCGDMQISPLGNKIAIGDCSGLLNLFDFNRSTGELSNFVRLGKKLDLEGTDTTEADLWNLGCAFSPSERYLYYSQRYKQNEWPHYFAQKIFQYDLIDNNTIKLFEQQLYPPVKPVFQIECVRLALAPNRKIYIHSVIYYYKYYFNYGHFGVIDYPDSAELDCRLQLTTGLSFEGKYGRGFIPNMPVNCLPLSEMSCYPAGKTDNFSTAFSIYPNPVNENLNISFDEQNILYEVELLNNLGQQIKKIIIESGVKSTYTLNLTDLPDGIYLLKLNTDKGNFTKKIIKN